MPQEKIISLDNLINDFIQYTYCERPLLHFLSLNPKIKIIISNHPLLTANSNNSEDEKIILKRSIHTLKKLLISNNYNEYLPFSKLGYSKDETIKLLTLSGVTEQINKTTSLIDIQDKLINIKNGMRQTAYNNPNNKNTIYCMGTCSFYGIGAPYHKTFESYLAKLFTKNNLPYKVDNVSQFYAGRYQDIFYNLNNLKLIPGDIVLLYLQDLSSPNFPLFDILNIFNRPHNYGEVFADKDHLNENGYKILADKFYSYLIKNNFFNDFKYPKYSFDKPHYYGIPELYNYPPPNFGGHTCASGNQKMDFYLEKISSFKPKIGSIVMNCNPFTNGHLHLVEYASKHSDKLYVFVVQTDKSFFKFKDRLDMVLAACSKFKNITVLPSGNFIISVNTFEDYFNKEKIQDKKIDATQDLEIFGKYIAPNLSINIRFAGEEPMDNVTKQYNQQMAKILPKFGVEFKEIPRLNYLSSPINATKIREAIKNKDIQFIKFRVPKTTFDIILKKYMN